MTVATASPGLCGGRVLASAAPYPWPYHGNFSPGRSALLACADPQWRLGGPASDEADRRLSQMATALRAAGALVIWAIALPPRPAGPPPALPAQPARGTTLALPCPLAGPEVAAGGDVVVEAGATSAFHASRLDGILRREARSDLVLAGWGLEGPVHSTLRAANDRGYECLLVADACTSLAPGLAEPACSMVQYSGGIFGAVARADQLLAMLAGPLLNPADPQEGQQ